MSSSSFTFVFLFLFSFLASFRADAQDPSYVYHICPNTTTFSGNSTYYTNLRTLLSSLSSPTTSYSSGFQNATAGQAPDRVSGLFLCRGDVTPEVCGRCVAIAVNETFTQCPNQREVTRYYEECMLRYSNRNILSTLNANGEFTMRNTQSITSNLVRFKDLVLSTMNQAASLASNSSRKFDAINVYFTDFQTLHGLVQCTPDLTNQECSDCLTRIINQLPTDRIGGRVIVPSCNARYELYLFYNGAADRTPQPPPPTVSVPPPRPGLIFLSISLTATSPFKTFKIC
ncbi:putative cysteine-rich receptor-like protein kinase 9 [Hirschfeldia incana]|nr:putative cysteine-rich receptor-like protein kinase 9 [Hirschfeldia incana]